MNTIRQNTKLGVALGILSVLVLAGLCTAATPPENSGHGAGTAPSQVTDKGHGAKVQADFGKLPMVFEQNKGQTDAQVSFLTRGAGYSAFLTPSEVVLRLKADKENRAVVRMKFLGSSPATQVKGAETLPGKTNYFIGNDSSKWATNVAQYASVRYADIYPGIDAVLHGDGGQLRYDFIVKPGADPKTIRLAFEGADKVAIDENGDLTLQVVGKPLVNRKPHIYQEGPGGVQQDVAGAFKVSRDGRVAFQIAKYDTRRPLVIDPTVQFSTYLGGSAIDTANGVTINATSIYVVGTTDSTNFPQPSPATGYQTTAHGLNDIFVAELNLAGTQLLAATYLGGTNNDFGTAVAVDASGNVTIVGQTYSTNFPVVNNGGAGSASLPGSDAAVVARFNSSLSTLLFSEYIGGSSNAIATGVAVDGALNAWVGGYTDSVNFPVTQGIPNHGSSDAFVAMVSPTGAVGPLATFGGIGADDAYGIALNTGAATAVASQIYIAGSTTSTCTTPTSGCGIATNGTALAGASPGAQNGVQDAFVMQIGYSAGVLTQTYGTYLGGYNSLYSTSGGHCNPIPATASCTTASGIAVDSAGRAYIAGQTNSTAGTGDFVPTLGAFQPKLTTTVKGDYDAFVAIIDPSQYSAPSTLLGSQLRYLTYYGGTNASDAATAIAIDQPITETITINGQPFTYPVDQNYLDYRQIYITGTTTFATGGADLLPVTTDTPPLGGNGCDIVQNTVVSGGLGVGGFNAAGPKAGVAGSFVARFNPNANFPNNCASIPSDAPLNFPPQLNYAQFYNGTGATESETATALALLPATRTLVIAGQTNSSTGIATNPPTLQINQGSAGVPDGFVTSITFNDIVTTAPELPQVPWAASQANCTPENPTCTLQTLANPSLTPLLFDYSNSDVDYINGQPWCLGTNCPPPNAPGTDWVNGIPWPMLYGNWTANIYTGGQGAGLQAWFLPTGAVQNCVGPPTSWTVGCDQQNVLLSNSATFTVSYTGSTETTFALPPDASVKNVTYSASNGVAIHTGEEWLCVSPIQDFGETTSCNGVPGITQDITPGVGRVTLDMENASKLPEGVYYATFAVCGSANDVACTPPTQPGGADNYSTLVTVTLWKHPTLLPFCADPTGATCGPTPLGPLVASGDAQPNTFVTKNGSVIDSAVGAPGELPVMTFVYDENATACVPAVTGCASSINLYAIDYLTAEEVYPTLLPTCAFPPASAVTPCEAIWPPLPNSGLINLPYGSPSPLVIPTPEIGGPETLSFTANNCSGPNGANPCAWLGLTVTPNGGGAVPCASPALTSTLTCVNAVPLEPVSGYPSAPPSITGNGSAPEFTGPVTVNLAFAANIAGIPTIPCPVNTDPTYTGPCYATGSYSAIVTVSGQRAKDVLPSLSAMVPPESSFPEAQCPIAEPSGWPFSAGLGVAAIFAFPGQNGPVCVPAGPNPPNSRTNTFYPVGTYEITFVVENTAQTIAIVPPQLPVPALGPGQSMLLTATVSDPYTTPPVGWANPDTIAWSLAPFPTSGPPSNPPCAGAVTVGPASNPGTLSGAGPSATETYTAPLTYSVSQVIVYGCRPTNSDFGDLTLTQLTIPLVPTAPLPPTAPTLTLPAGSATGVFGLPTLTWQSAAGATSYNVFIGTTTPPTTQVATGITGTSYTLTTNLLPGTTYYWMVAAVGSGGTTNSATWSFTTESRPPSYVSGDFNGSGYPDLVWVNTSTGQATVWFEQGTTFQSFAYLPMSIPTGWNLVAINDFNQDGIPDLVLQYGPDGPVTVWYIGPGQTFLGWAYLNAGGSPGWTVKGAIDFNGDGVPDLIYQNTTTQQVVVDYYDQTTLTGTPQLLGWAWLNAGGNPAPWTVVGAADFALSGTPALIWQNATTNQVTVNYYSAPVNYLAAPTLTGFAYLIGEPGWTVAGANDYNTANGLYPDLVWENNTTQQVTVDYYDNFTFLNWVWISQAGEPGWQVIVPQ